MDGLINGFVTPARTMTVRKGQ